jgi:hypothetical protein
MLDRNHRRLLFALFTWVQSATQSQRSWLSKTHMLRAILDCLIGNGICEIYPPATHAISTSTYSFVDQKSLMVLWGPGWVWKSAIQDWRKQACL